MAEVRSRTEEASEASTGQLVARLSDEVSQLIRDELRLAQLELKQKGKRLGVGAGLTGVAGIAAFLGAAALVTAAIAAVTIVLPVWASALVVAGAVFLVAGILALTGIGQAKRSSPPIPTQAIEDAKRDIETVKESARR